MFIQLYYCNLFPVPSVTERLIQLDDVLDNQRVHHLQKYECLVPANTKKYLDQVPEGFRISSILLLAMQRGRTGQFQGSIPHTIKCDTEMCGFRHSYFRLL